MNWIWYRYSSCHSCSSCCWGDTLQKNPKSLCFKSQWNLPRLLFK